MNIRMQSLKLLLVAAVLAPVASWADPLGQRSLETVSEVMEGLRLEGQRRRREGRTFTPEEQRANQQRLAQARPDEGAIADDGLLGVAESLERLLCSRSCDPRCRVIEVKQIGEENREFVRESSRNLFAGVGRVICTLPSGRETVATATVVGDRNTLLSVAHYRTDKPTRQTGEFSTCRFELYDSSGRITFTSRLAAETGSHTPEENLTMGTADPDWSVLKMVNPVPSSVIPMRVARLSTAEAAQLDDVYMIGYHLGLRVSPETLLISPNCRPQQNGGESRVLFRHTCDTSAGASGGLLFTETPDGPLAIGIHTRAASSNQNWNYAQVLPPSAIAMIPGRSVRFAELQRPSQNENY